MNILGEIIISGFAPPQENVGVSQKDLVTQMFIAV